MPPVPRPGSKKQGPQKNRNRTLLLALAGAAVLAAALIVGSIVLTGGDGEGGAAVTTPETSLLDGIPQDGIVLGDPKATVTLIEYADMQCPVCARYSEEGFPTLVEEYVKTGKIKMEFRGLAFLGPDSLKALQFVEAAGLQDRLWHMQDGLFANQGEENSGWVTDDLLREVGGSIEGLDVDKMFADSTSSEVAQAMTKANEQGKAAGVPGTPWFFIQIGDDEPYEIRPQTLGPESFRPALDDALSE